MVNIIIPYNPKYPGRGGIPGGKFPLKLTKSIFGRSLRTSRIFFSYLFTSFVYIHFSELFYMKQNERHFQRHYSLDYWKVSFCCKMMESGFIYWLRYSSYSSWNQWNILTLWWQGLLIVSWGPYHQCVSHCGCICGVWGSSCSNMTWPESLIGDTWLLLLRAYGIWEFRANYFGISWDFMDFFSDMDFFFGKVYSDLSLGMRLDLPYTWCTRQGVIRGTELVNAPVKFGYDF